MAVLRLPNPGSDLDRFVSTFALIARDASTNQFDLDFMTNVMAENFQASSMGAHGQEAVRLSTRDDRTRDPLFNQSKMYSELYRMLGWIRSDVDSHSKFTVTPLGQTVMHYQLAGGQQTRGLVAESFISAVFPNPSTVNVGITNHRPFAQLLKLAHMLNGEITRDEMIVGVLSITDDLAPNAIKNQAEKILGFRKKSKKAASEAVEKIALKNNLQVNTLENYTRLPVAILGSEYLGWGNGVYSNTTYSSKEKLKIIRLTEAGKNQAEKLLISNDLRAESLFEFSILERAWLAQFGYYAMAMRAGITEAEIVDKVKASQVNASEIMRKLSIKDAIHLIYNPSLQESDEVLKKTLEL